MGISYQTVLDIRRDLQANAAQLQPDTPLPDQVTESDEMFQNVGKKGDEHVEPHDRPRCRANKRRGRGTYANDRRPILGTVGRETGQVRLRVVDDTKGITLSEHVQRFTCEEALVNTDEYQSYNSIQRDRNTNFLRPFKGVHKKYLSGYIAICEFRRNLKHISPDFISQLVRFHTFYT